MKDDDAFADQKYLDGWPGLFKNVTVVQRKSANVAPWNLDNYDIRTIMVKCTSMMIR